MAEINGKHDSHYAYGAKNFVYDPSNIESSSLPDLLVPIIKILKDEVSETRKHLLAVEDPKEDTQEFIKMIEVVELLVSHFEFTLEVLNSESEKEVQEIKKKYNQISEVYDQVKTKDDMSPVPAKYVVVLYHDKMIVELLKVLKRCFKIRHGEVKFLKTHDNLAKISILTYRFELGEEHYPRIITFPKDDIFYLPKNDPIWLDLYNHVTFKQILTEQESISSFKTFELTNNIGHVIVKNQLEHKGILNFKGAVSLLADLMYYGVYQRKAETHALRRLVHPDPDNAFLVWNLPEEPFVALMLSFDYPIIGYDELIYLPRLFPKITKELILKEYKENSFNKINPLDKSSFKAPDLLSNKEKVLEELFIEDKDRVQVRILSNDPLNLREGFATMMRTAILKATRVITGPAQLQPQFPAVEPEAAIIIHIHGGGFVSMSSGSHRIYLNRWVKNLKLVLFSIDYRLAPNNMYPDALDDVWQAYFWILNYAETILGIKNKKIILVGDSAGGTLALALQTRLIRAGFPPAHGCLLIYPALTVDEHSCSPSAFASLDDPVLPTSLLKLCVRAYIGDGDEFKSKEDPCISPLVASDELLEKLPPIRMIVGSKDPLHDDSWRFLAKLRRINKDVKLIVHEHIRHAYLCHQKLKKYHVFMEEACDLIRELIDKDHTQIKVQDKVKVEVEVGGQQ